MGELRCGHHGPGGLEMIARPARWFAGLLSASMACVCGAVTAGTEPAGEISRRVVAAPEPKDRAQMELGFDADGGLAISLDGRRAAVWSNRPLENGRPTKEGPRMALVDLDTPRVLAVGVLPKPVTDAAVDGETICVSTSQPDLIETYTPHGQELKSIARRFTRGPVSKVTLPGGVIVVGGELRRMQDLKPVTDPPRALGLPVVPGSSTMVGSVTYRIVEGWVIGGGVVDPDFESTRLLVSPSSGTNVSLPMGEGHSSSELFSSPFFAGLPVGYPWPWDRWVLKHNRQIIRLVPEEGAPLGRRTGQNIGSNERPERVRGFTQACEVMVDHPVGLRFKVVVRDLPGDPGMIADLEDQSVLELLHLDDGSVGETIILETEVVRHEQDAESRQRYREVLDVVAQGRRAVCARRDRLYVVDLSDEQLARFRSPFRIVPEQQALVVSADGTTTLATRIDGGQEGEATFNLVEPVAGLSIDEETGTVTVDGPALVKGAAPVVIQSRLDLRNPVLAEVTVSTVSKALTPDLEWVGPRFQRLTGREPRGFPVSVPVYILAESERGQSASLLYHVVVEVPPATLVAPIREAKEQLRRLLEAERRASEEGATPCGGLGAPGRSSTGGTTSATTSGGS